MNKELEALERLAMPDELHIEECKRLGIGLTDDYDLIKKALLELKAIKEANPSKALKDLKELRDYLLRDRVNISSTNYYNTIEQALLKSQEQEKALKIIFEKRIDMWHLVDLLDQTYEMYLAFCESEKYEKDYILTEEEFDLLKRWLR